MRELRRAWAARIGLPASRWMLEFGTFLLRSESELVLKSRRVVPGRLSEAGFTFEQPNWRAAAAELVARWRSGGRLHQGQRLSHNELRQAKQSHARPPEGTA